MEIIRRQNKDGGLEDGDLGEKMMEEALALMKDHLCASPHELVLVVPEETSFLAGRLVEKYGLKSGIVLPRGMAKGDSWALTLDDWAAFYSLGAFG